MRSGVLLGAGVLALAVALPVLLDRSPTTAEHDAALFGVPTVIEAPVPVLALDHRPTLADAAGLPEGPVAGLGTAVAPVGPPRAVPVQKIHRTPTGVTLLVLADTTCRFRGVLTGPGAAPLEVLVAMEPTELSDGGATATCGPGALAHSYSVFAIDRPSVTAVADVGAGGRATPVG